jgi:2'-5' RNA ligase
MKRIFIAIKTEAGPELQKTLATFRSVLGAERIKWVDPVNIHLTLAFLGDTEEGRIKSLSVMLTERCRDFGKFSFQIIGTGVFKSLRDPRVIWIGVESSDKLNKLNEQIVEGLKENGSQLEERLFRPHITIGRIKSLKDAENLKMLVGRYENKVIQTVDVREVILYESILMPTGPLYKSLGIFEL